MRQFEKAGGGTLILKKGTYRLSKSIAVPSNVNIVLENGVKLHIWRKTGVKGLGVDNAVFQLVAPSKIQRKEVYRKYNGVKNVKIIGKGIATINLRYKSPVHAIVVAHAKNIHIQGITFRNSNNGHFLEVDAVKKMSITRCKFIGSRPSAKLKTEAINLDTPDKNTLGFTAIWSFKDRTPNVNIRIASNYFKNVCRAIGTHKYSQNKYNGKYVVGKGQRYHTNIIISQNHITNTRSEGIRVLNWKNAKIVNNYIANIPKTNNYRGIMATGVDIKIRNNLFYNILRPVQFFPTKNTPPGSMYSVSYNHLTPKNFADLKMNLCIKTNENYGMYTNYYPVKASERIYMLTK